MSFLKNPRAQRFLTSFVILFALLSFWENGNQTQSISRHLEQKTFDFRLQNFSLPASPSDKIVFIDIDDRSLDTMNSEHQKWPWKPSVWKDTLDLISLGGPKTVLIDILFKEEIFFPFPNVSTALTLAQLNARRLNRSPTNLQNVHAVNARKDEDGIFRSTPLYLKNGLTSFPSLSLKALELFFGRSDWTRNENELLLTTENSQSIQIPLDSRNQLKIRFYQKDFLHVPFGPIYSLSRKSKDKSITAKQIAQYLNTHFKDKIVIIGSSAHRLGDLKATPIYQHYPGALIHATAVSNVLERDFIKKPCSVLWMGLFLIGLIYLNFAFLSSRLVQNVLPIFLLGTYFLFSSYLFYVEQIDLPLASPLLFGLLSYADGLITSLSFESFPIRKNSLRHQLVR